ncbi:hypothetical protein Athai_01820 [Actinocatenispora thailandica]|uniref:DUF5667 domain-containing protein n=1 Tax=Actinocatenispora thailandica TaxID=227318 RepID=A0A7R7DJ88_9ACTN|nr:DUF5667 domain-containing protein [Actinocatenispora thailandica]BCJ32679.1 hypothetical protein Athai_01820 [Actinocatenispora thailandica]
MRLFLRRRTERFAQLVADDLPDHDDAERQAGHHQARAGHHTRDEDDTLALLVRVGREVSAQASTFERSHRMDTDAKADIRRRLLADAAIHGIGAARADAEADTDTSVRTHGTPRPTRHAVPPNRRPKVRLIVIGGVVAGALGISGVAAASTSAVPGDALYNVKRSTERAQIALAGSDSNSGQLYLQFARTRSGEAGAVSDDPAELSRVLGDMDRETRQGVSLLDSTAVHDRSAAALDQVDAFTAAQRPVVARLAGRLTGSSHDRAQHSLELVDQVRQRSTELRRLLLCTTGKSVKRDALGPVPQSCAALPGAKPDPSGTGQGSGRQSGRPPAETSPSGKSSASPSPSASGSPSGSGAPSSSESGSPAPSPSSSDSGGGGLLGTIGKILGGLL